MSKKPRRNRKALTMTDATSENDDRKVSVIITIRIDSIPLSEVAAIEKQAFDVGDEWGAVVNVNKGAARPALQG